MTGNRARETTNGEEADTLGALTLWTSSLLNPKPHQDAKSLIPRSLDAKAEKVSV